jgi:carbon monoxide dehydrogenase subunit G
MVKVESSVKEIGRSVEEVFNYLSDMRNLEPHVPKDKLKDFSAGTDYCSFKVEMIGDMNVRIVEKDTNKAIKYSGDDKSSIPFNLWVQVREVQPGNTYMKLTLHAEVNMMMKMIVEPVMKTGIDTIADRIAEVLNAQLKQDL